ncbi:MAG: winged helix-turn-helix domain-containing protein [Acetobacteraceae bacterium]|nr:winged helix-turn-helix domain-containing protein [Acetobacteraceae bacterium]
MRLHLQGRPLQVLGILLERPGEVLTYQELRGKVWPDDTFVDFEHSLHNAVARLREALKDSADSPRFIETVPRRGYRFIAPVEAVGCITPSVPAQTAEPRARRAGKPWKWTATAAALFVVGALVLCLLVYLLVRPRVSHRIMIAVLPVANLTGDAAREYIADGLTEEIITELSQYNPERLGVIARTSSMAYKHKARTVNQIGRELSVDYVVESSLRATGQHLRITSQLVRVRDQTHLWSATYDRALTDLFGFQDDLSQAIALNVQVNLANALKRRLPRTAPKNPDAYLAYLEGRYHWNRRTPESLTAATVDFKRAIEIEPGYAEAYAGLSDAYSSLCLIADVPPRKYFPQAREMALKAISLDDSLADGHASLASVKLWFDWDWRGSEAEFRRALDLNPGYATAHQWYAEYLRLMGREQAAIAEGKMALQLDPLSLIINMESGLPYYFEGRYREAIRYFQKTLEMDPNFALAHCELGWALEEEGDREGAVRELRRALELDDAPPILASLGHAYAGMGKRAEAETILRQLEQRAERSYVGPDFYALVYAGLGERDKAFDALEKAYADRHWALIWLKVAHKFDSLRPDPRYSKFLSRMNFPP